MLLAAVGVAAVHHHGRAQAGFLQVVAGGIDVGLVVVGLLAATQDHVAVRVAFGVHDGDMAALVHRQEVVAARCRLDRVGSNLQVAVGTILEADRGRQAAGQFAVDLAFGGACTNRAPGDQVADVLRGDHVQELAAGRQVQAVDVDQQLTRNAQALVDAAAFVQVGVVDQALPAHRGARLLEVDAHHDFQRVGEVVALLLQALRVLQRCLGIMDRAGADDDQQAVILATHDLLDGLAGVAHQFFNRGALDREEADQVFGRGQHGQALDAGVVSRSSLVGRLRIQSRVAGLGRGHRRAPV